jgi:GT2 family glycosyltransferase
VPSLSVIIPATDGRQTLERTIVAINRAEAGPDEVIVVDEPSGIGPAAARNRGARRATGDVLVFVDADVVVHADAFARIRRAFDRDPGLAAVFGSYDDDPAGDGPVSDYRNLLHHHVHNEGAGPATTFWAGLGAMRRDAFLELHGFDESRFPRPSVEDIELGSRLHARGGAILLDPSIQGKHLKRWTLASMSTTDLLSRGVPWMRLILEGRSSRAALNLGWRHRLSTAGSVLLIPLLIRRRFSPAVAVLGLLVLVDWPFYALLRRRRGARLLVAAIPLHVLHRLTSAAAVPLAIAMHLRSTLREPPSRG